MSSTSDIANLTRHGFIRHGFFSPSASQAYGHSVYEGVDGEPKSVTFVCQKEALGEGYQWPDKVYVGEINYMKCISNGEKHITEASRWDDWNDWD